MIHAEHLSLWYGRTRALFDASFDVRQGEVLGLLGPNGAGKSTTLKILTTYLQPNEGRVLVDGTDVALDPIAVRRRMGYLPETAPLYPEMTVAEYLSFCGRARGLSGRRLAQRSDAVVADCGLESAWNRPIAHLSKGFRQRTGLAQALIHDPDILVLDEPTSGLDPLQILEIRRLIRELSARKTILFSTHVLQEIDAVSDRVMIINEGRIIAQGTPLELQQRSMGDDRLLVEVEAPVADVEAALARCPGVLGVEGVDRPSTGVARAVARHAWGDEAAPRAVAALLAQKGWPLRRLAPERHSLERVFIELTRARGTAKGRPETAAPEAAA